MYGTRYWVGLGALVAWAMASNAFASDDIPAAPAQADSTTEEPSSADQMIETTRQSVRSTVEWLASGIDSRFGDKPFTDGGKVTDGQLGLAYLNREGQSSHINIRFNARFRLPNLSQFQYVYLGNDSERNVVTDQPDRRSLRDQIRDRNGADNSFFAGLGMWLAESIDVRIGFRGPLRPYTQARVRHEWQLSPYDWVEARETVFYTVKDRAGSTTALEYQHALAPDLALRWLNSGTITQSSPHMAWNSTLGLYQSFGRDRVLGLELQHSGSEQDGVSTNDVGVQARWEQPIHKNVLGEVSLGHFWTKTSMEPHREGQWAIGLAVSLKF
ncbi:MAG: hypothetical protein KGL57_08080 [Burkholderiales bacterium]|nr:hypothetical protein [Burkholderiales bacterium]